MDNGLVGAGLPMAAAASYTRPTPIFHAMPRTGVAGERVSGETGGSINLGEPDRRQHGGLSAIRVLRGILRLTPAVALN